MAIISAAGASFTRIHEPSGGSTPVSFTNQSYAGWIKLPSVGARTLFDHNGLLIIAIDETNKITLTVNGTLYTGVTVLPLDKWITWTYKRTSGSGHRVRVSWVDCVVDVPSQSTILTEINVSQASSGTPTQFTWFAPPNCPVCSFKYGGSSSNVENSTTSWASQSSFLIWSVVARFPNDLYDHREISVSSAPFVSDPTFAGMHDWTSKSGSVALYGGSDPEILLNKICSAVVGLGNYNPPITFDHPSVPPPIVNQIFTTEKPFPIAILTDVLPTTAILEFIKVGSRTIYDGTNFPGPEITPIDGDAKWSYGVDPTGYLHDFGDIGQLGYYDWSDWGAPNPQVVNESTGVPWTLADLYGASLIGVTDWGPFTYLDTLGSGFPANLRTRYTYEVGISCTYFGIVGANTCGDIPPPPGTGRIIVLKIVE